MMGVVLAGATTTVYAQEDNKAVVARVSEIIKAKGADTESQVKEIFKANKKNPEVLVGIGRAYLDVKDTINAYLKAFFRMKRKRKRGRIYCASAYKLSLLYDVKRKRSNFSYS